jgi:hypothetical protein
MVVTIKTMVYCYAIPYSLIDRYKAFGKILLPPSSIQQVLKWIQKFFGKEHWYLTSRLHTIISHKSVILSTKAMWKVTSFYFGQLIQERGRAHASEVASYDSLPCKPSYNWAPSVCSCLYRMSYDVSRN